MAASATERWLSISLRARLYLGASTGAQEMVKRGVLVTRLSAIEEADSMDLLCTDAAVEAELTTLVKRGIRC